MYESQAISLRASSSVAAQPRQIIDSNRSLEGTAAEQILTKHDATADEGQGGLETFRDLFGLV